MKAKLSLAPAVLIVLAMALLVPGQASAKNYVRYDFEKDLAPWNGGTNSPTGIFTFQRQTGDNGCLDVPGKAYANLKMATTSTRSVAWMISAHTVEYPGEQAVRVKFTARSTGNCDTCSPLIYAGPDKPSMSSDFTRATPAPFDNVAAGGWTTYLYDTSAYVHDSLYLALGWKFNSLPVPFGNMLSNANLLNKSAPEAPMQAGSYGFDCVSLSIFQAP